MSAKVLTIPNRMTECVACGALVVGQFLCEGCARWHEDQRRAAKARLFAGMARERRGVTVYQAKPSSRRTPLDWPGWMLVGLLLFSTVAAGCLLAAGWVLGKAAIAWLCAVSA